jgi:hypothetical protein
MFSDTDSRFSEKISTRYNTKRSIKTTEDTVLEIKALECKSIMPKLSLHLDGVMGQIITYV